MNRLLLSGVIIFLLPNAIITQNWTEPVNVSNLDGIDYQPKIAIDNTGTIHCVWIHQYTSFFWKVFYSKSVDNGQTWETPQDVSMNDSICISRPNIVTDSQNKVYVSYDFDVQNPNMTQIILKYFDGINWSEADTISDNLYASWNNKLFIDNNDNLYCFWYRNMLSGTMYYRTSEDGITWSEINIPYSNGLLFPVDFDVDEDNNLHGMGIYKNQVGDNGKYVYFKYELQNTSWSIIENISGQTSGGGSDIVCDFNNNPYFVWRQNTPGTGPNEDSTMYRYFDGDNWSEPELIVEDPFSQKIAIVENEVFIIDWEKDGDSGNVVFYKKDENNNWIGEIILNADIVNPEDFIAYNNQLNLILLSNITDENYDIYYMNMIVDTSTRVKKNEFYLKQVNLFPNPFNYFTTIQFEIRKSGDVSIKVYELNGKLINSLSNKAMVAGKHNVNWDGSDENGTKVKPGFYLIRVQAEKNIITRSVELY
jgi:hypothetical protein